MPKLPHSGEQPGDLPVGRSAPSAETLAMVRRKDLEAALSPFTADGNVPSDLTAAIDRVLSDPDGEMLTIESDLTRMSIDELAKKDHIAHARVAYLVSYMRLATYLRTPATSMEEANAQARVGFQFLKHAENTNLKEILARRTAGDEELASTREELLQEVHRLARQMAEATRRQEARQAAGKEGVMDAEVLPS